MPGHIGSEGYRAASGVGGAPGALGSVPTGRECEVVWQERDVVHDLERRLRFHCRDGAEGRAAVRLPCC